MATRKQPRPETPSSRPPRVLAAVVALSLAAWVVVVQEGGPELDASTAQQSLAVLDEWLSDDTSRVER